MRLKFRLVGGFYEIDESDLARLFGIIVELIKAVPIGTSVRFIMELVAFGVEVVEKF